MLQATGKTRIFSANGFFARPDEEGIKTSCSDFLFHFCTVFSRALMKRGLRLDQHRTNERGDGARLLSLRAKVRATVQAVERAIKSLIE